MNYTLDVIPEHAGERADKYVARELPEHSRAFWQKQFDLGYVQNNGKTIGDKTAVAAGSVTITMPERIITTLDLPIMYEDDDVIVINKPAGVLTHAKGTAVEEATVADFVRPKSTDAPEGNRPGIVHRLDRDTSGVMIAAKNPEAKVWLQKQFSDRKVKKTYIALTEGILEPKEAILKLPIERNPKSPQTFRVGAGGKYAETAYEVIEYLPKYTLVELRPYTGRTHQLRVHMTYLGHPIVGDRFYGAKPAERLFLHAASLELTLPNKKRETFRAPLPPDLTQELEKRR